MERFAAQLQQAHPRNIVPLISVEKLEMPEHKAGVVMEATIPVAARALSKSTHRVASEDEYAAYKQDLAERTKSLKRQEDEKKGIVHPEAVEQRQKKIEGK
jgi:hypothetical protein